MANLKIVAETHVKKHWTAETEPGPADLWVLEHWPLCIACTELLRREWRSAEDKRGVRVRMDQGEEGGEQHECDGIATVLNSRGQSRGGISTRLGRALLAGDAAYSHEGWYMIVVEGSALNVIASISTRLLWGTVGWGTSQVTRGDANEGKKGPKERTTKRGL